MYLFINLVGHAFYISLSMASKLNFDVATLLNIISLSAFPASHLSRHVHVRLLNEYSPPFAPVMQQESQRKCGPGRRFRHLNLTLVMVVIQDYALLSSLCSFLLARLTHQLTVSDWIDYRPFGPA